MKSGKWLLILSLFLALLSNCGEEISDPPLDFNNQSQGTRKNISDQVLSIDMALRSMKQDSNILWKDKAWEVGEIRGEIKAAYKNDRLIFLHYNSHSSFGSTLQEFFISADNLIFMHEYTVNKNCYEGHIICVSEYKHYFTRNTFISGVERNTRIPYSEVKNFTPPFYKSAFQEIAFEGIYEQDEAILKSDRAKYEQARIKWESMN